MIRADVFAWRLVAKVNVHVNRFCIYKRRFLPATRESTKRFFQVTGLLGKRKWLGSRES